MAKISQSSITLELETLSCDEVGNGIVMLDITVEEAQELRKLLNERFNENTTSGPLQHTNGAGIWLDNTTPINSTAEHD